MQILTNQLVLILICYAFVTNVGKNEIKLRSFENSSLGQFRFDDYIFCHLGLDEIRLLQG